MRTTLRGVHLGYMGMDKEMLLFPHPNYILNTQRREAQKVWYHCPALAYIVDHPDGRILFETGISANWPAEWLQEWQWLVDLSEITPEVCLEARLKAMGLGPDDFRYVVAGHLHCDHAGGLRLFADAGATIVVHENEYNHVRTLQSAAENFFVAADWNFLEGVKPEVVTGDEEELLEGVKVISLPGHTPGTMGAMINLESTGSVLLSTDALYSHESYGPPAVGTPITHNIPQWAQSVEKLRKIATENDSFLFPGHDETGIRHRKGQTEFETINFSPGYEYQ